MIEESIMEHTCLPDDRVDQRGISHMSVIKLNSVSFHKLIYLLNTFTLEKLILQLRFNQKKNNKIYNVIMS